MAGAKAGCVGWQVTRCDPIWQVTSPSSESELEFNKELGLYTLLNLTKRNMYTVGRVSCKFNVAMAL